MSRRKGFLAICVTIVLAEAAPQVPKMEGGVYRGARIAESGTDRQTSALRRMRRPQRSYRLGAVSAEESRARLRKPGLTPVGIARSVPPEALARGEWSTSPEGTRTWRLEVASAGAVALRVHFTDFDVKSGKVSVLAVNSLAVNSDDLSIAGPYTGQGPSGDGEFWSDLLPGESVIVAYEPSADDSTDAIPFRIQEVSHRTAPNSAKKADVVAPTAAAASCTVDLACHPNYREPASAVALMIFESDGASYQCSGALISSASSPALPFFMTANHCVSTAAEAKSLIAFFDYQTPDCNGTPPVLTRSPRVTGATFLAGEGLALGDFTLLQLTAFPTIDVKLLGWTADEIASNQQVTSISHPRGDFKRIAFGQRTRDVPIRFNDGDRMPANRGLQVTWFEGVTQGGSSGSPLLAAVNGKEYLVGTLTGGPDVDEDDSTQVCSSRNLNSSYGRFSAAYPYLASYLTSTTGVGAPLAQVQASITASPLSLAFGQTVGVSTLTWNAGSAAHVQIRAGSPTGPAMTGIEGSTGSVQTGPWAAPGMRFYLQDATSGDSSGASKTLASTQVQAAAPTGLKSGSIIAGPNPITVAAGQTTGSTTLTWRATGVSRVQIRIGSPSGVAMTGPESPFGSATTPIWVTHGMTFFLQDATDGDSTGPGKTLAAVRVHLAGL